MASAQKYVLGGEYDLGGGTLGVWDGKGFVSPDEYVARKARGRVDMLNNQEKASLDDARAASSNAITVLSDLNNFQNQLDGRGMKAQETGGWFDGFANRMAAKMGDPEAQRLAGITATLAPSKRPPGSGTTSDKDLALYLKGTPGLDKDANTNRAILEDGRREAVRRQQRADFMEAWATKNGTLNGAEQAFRAVVGRGTMESPLSVQDAGDRSTTPRGSFYYDPQGNVRRNDNGSAGNPIIKKAPPIPEAPRASSGPTVPSDAVNYLRQNNTPQMRAAFDQKFGAGASQRYLSGR